MLLANRLHVQWQVALESVRLGDNVRKAVCACGDFIYSVEEECYQCCVGILGGLFKESGECC